MIEAAANDPFKIELEDGVAYPIGDGLMVVLQADEKAPEGGHSVAITKADLANLSEAKGLHPVALEEDGGEAICIGDTWVLKQPDVSREGHPMQRAVVTWQDVEAMLAAA
ncbi:hypothetical protein [uncultured Sphingomonas sp.]|uniref:hypothetical protein n=1 Tax=uncultured Sphingomonas sp. TaxID=158754 RepID=UPI0025D4EEC5|nr:hypothetical protein [uncultured Sphingomonas sp.]